MTEHDPERPYSGDASDSEDVDAERESRELAAAILNLADDLDRKRVGRVVCITEEGSALGPLEHMRVVLRRIRCGEPGAVQLDGHFVLTEAALQEELAMARQLRRQKREDA